MAISGAIKAGQAYVELLADDQQLHRGLRRAQRRMQAFGTAVSSIGRKLALAGTAGLGAFAVGVRQFISQGDQLDKMAKRTGITVEALSELGFAAEQSGADLGTLENGVRRMQRSIEDAGRGLSTQVDALNTLGLSYADLANKSPEEQFKLIADRMAAIEDPTKRAAAAQMLFGRAGTQLLPLMEEGAAGIEKLQKTYRDLGGTMSTEAAANAADLADEMNTLWGIVKIAAREVGAALAPKLIEVAKALQRTTVRVVEWIKGNQDAIATTAKWIAKITAAGVALVAIGGTIQVVASAVGGLSLAVKGLNAALALIAKNPAGIAVIALTGAFTALGVAIASVRNEAAQLSDSYAKASSAGDRLRAQDADRLRRLRELSQKEELSNEQRAEAAELIRALESTYGDLGLSIDDVTGKIDGMADAFDRLFDAMARPVMLDLEKSIAEREENIRRLQQQFDSNSGFGARNREAYLEELRDVQEQIRAEGALLRADRERLSKLRGGVITEQTVTGAEPGAGGPPSIPVTAANSGSPEVDELEARIQRLRNQQIEDDLSRELAMLNDRYAKEERLMKQQAAEETELIRARARLDEEFAQIAQSKIEAIEAASEEKLAKLREAKWLEYIAIRKRTFDQEAEERRRREARIAEGNEDLQERIEELRLRASGLDDDELQRRLLDLQEKRAHEDARERGLDLDLVREKFDLERAMLDMQEENKSRFSAVGDFSVASLQKLHFTAELDTSDVRVETEEQKTGLDPEETTAKETAESKRVLVDIYDEVRNLRRATRGHPAWR